MNDPSGLGGRGLAFLRKLEGVQAEEAIIILLLELAVKLLLFGEFIACMVAWQAPRRFCKATAELCKDMLSKVILAVDRPQNLGDLNDELTQQLGGTPANLPQPSIQAALLQCEQCLAGCLATSVVRCPGRHTICSDCLSGGAAQQLVLEFVPLVCPVCGLTFGPAELGSLLLHRTAEAAKEPGTLFDAQDWIEAEQGEGPAVPAHNNDDFCTAEDGSEEEQGDDTTGKIQASISQCIAQITGTRAPEYRAGEPQLMSSCSTHDPSQDAYSPLGSDTDEDVYRYQRSLHAARQLVISAPLPQEAPCIDQLGAPSATAPPIRGTAAAEEDDDPQLEALRGTLKDARRIRDNARERLRRAAKKHGEEGTPQTLAKVEKETWECEEARGKVAEAVRAVEQWGDSA